MNDQIRQKYRNTYVQLEQSVKAQLERSKSDRTPCTSLTIDEWPLNNGPLQAKLLGGGSTQVNGLFKTRPWIQSLLRYIRLWQGFAAGDGLLMTVVCFGHWSASDNGPLDSSGPPNKTGCQWHWFASCDSIRADAALDNGQFMAVVRDHANLMERLSIVLAPILGSGWARCSRLLRKYLIRKLTNI